MSELVRAARSLAHRHEGLELAAIQGGVVSLSDDELAAFRGLAVSAADARTLREDLVRWIASKNQFFHVETATAAEIDDAIVRLGTALASGALDEAQDVLDDVLDGLASLMASALGTAPREVVASEYTPELQLAVLHLTPRDLASPLLDIGCGTGAALVRRARSLGLEATGIDRDAPDDAVRADWMSFDYGVARYRLIVSHLAFSLHFAHAHRKSEADARRYAETYVRITRALAPGGRFVYVPSVPFFEPVLPSAHFHVEHHRVIGGETLEGLRRSSGIDLAEATHLIRVG
jgi:hypothetical protein